MAVGDFIRLAMRGTMHGHMIVNTFVYRHATGPLEGQDAVITLGNAFINNNVPLYTAVQSSEVQQVALECQLIGPGAVQARVDLTINLPGDLVDAPVPDTVALCIKRQGLFAGRRNRGRIFVPGIGSTAYNAVTGKFLGGFAGFGILTGSLVLDLTSLGGDNVFQPVLYQKPLGTYTLLVDSHLDIIPRSQRRRELDKGA